MENQQQNSKKKRQGRFMLIVPVLIVPFITLMFWALGGGKANGASGTPKAGKGFNSMLPGANLKDDKDLDKMSYYDKAAKDTADRKSQLGSDPYYREMATGFPAPGSIGSPYYGNGSLNTDPFGTGGRDPYEAKIYQRLDQLNKALEPQAQSQSFATDAYAMPGQPGANHDDIARLQKMIGAMNATESEPDPEMEQLSGMLDKIMDIQNPGRQQEKLRQLSEERKGRVYAVVPAKKEQRISLLEEKTQSPIDGKSATGKDQNGFFSLDTETTEENQQNAVDAVIAETQTIVSGSTVKLRLLDDIFINGKLVPKDHYLFGIASLSGERLMINIPAVRFQKSVYPVALAVTDIDGIAGIYIPGAIARDVAKQSTEGAIQDLSFGTSMSNSVGLQAAGAGLEAAKSFFSKKVKLIKVTVKAGYKVLLMDEKQKQDN